MSSKSLSDRTLAKLEALLLVLRSVATVDEGFRVGQTPQKLSSDWRYLQQYLAPEILLHTHDPSYESAAIRYVPGIIIIPSVGISMAADVHKVQSWLDSNIRREDAKVGEPFKEIESLINSRIKSRDGKAKASRLLKSLKSMLSE